MKINKSQTVAICSEEDPSFPLRVFHIFYSNGLRIDAMAEQCFFVGDETWCVRNISPYQIMEWKYNVDGTREYIGTFMR